MDGNIAHVSGRIADLLNDQVGSASISEQALATISQMTRRSRKSSELRYPQRYLQISRYPMTTAFFPHWGLPTSPDRSGAPTCQDAWEWVYSRAREHLQRPDWRHAEYIDSICRIPLELLRALGRCAYP